MKSFVGFMLRVVPRVYFFGLIKFDFVGKFQPEVKWKTLLQVGFNSRNQSRIQFQESNPGINSRNTNLESILGIQTWIQFQESKFISFL